MRLEAGGEVEVGLVVWDGDHTLSGDTLTLGKLPVGDPRNVASGNNPSAIACVAAPGGCAWRTPGLDVLRFRETVEMGTATTLVAGADPLEVGVLAVLTETPQAPSLPSNSR